MPQELRDVRLELPAVRSPDAVHDGEVPSLLRIHVVFPVGIHSGDDIFRRVGADLFLYGIDDGLRLPASKSRIDKVILHINYQQYFSHLALLPSPS